jgi:hypothetical protein
MSSGADVPSDAVELIEIDQGQLRQHVDGLVRDAVVCRPPGMPGCIQVTYPKTAGDPLRFEVCEPRKRPPYQYTGACYSPCSN